MRRGRQISFDEQRSRDMLWLMGRPEFLRFLFTVAEKAGIASAAYGSNLDTSSFDGRRSLGIDILRMADDVLPVRNPALSPFNALGLAISEVSRFTTQEGSDDAEEDDQPDYSPAR
jgi:hypothetical protein